MNKLQAIVFDLDDTLYSERDYVMSGFKAVAEWAAIELGADEQYSRHTLLDLYCRGVRNNTFDQWLTIHGIDRPDVIPTLLDVYRKHRPSIEPFDGLTELLTSLLPAYRIGLVSDGYLEVQQRKWQALRLHHFFDAVVFSDSLGRENWKPSTAPFKLVLEQLNVDPAASVYIGDNPRKDFFGARQLGMQTIWLKQVDSEYGHLQPQSLDYSPDLTIDSLAQVLDSIAQLEQ